MRATIIGGGTIADYEYVKAHVKSYDAIICADSGYYHAKMMGLAPEIVVGDFDSLGDKPKDTPILCYPENKDSTDTEIAVEYAFSKGYREFLLLAVTGSRIDHSLANILLLKNVIERGCSATIIDEHNKIMITDSELRLSEPRGSIVSLIPLSDCSGVTINNCKYPLHKASMRMGASLGVSNIMTDDNAALTVEHGLMLVIVAKD